MLTLKQVFRFWLPLALSWWMMTVAGPWIQGVISRQPDAETQLAAFGIVMSLSITIEAPVIMMLATSTALAHHQQAYQALWRYMMLVNVFVTIVAILFAFTPIFDLWVGDVLGIPNSVKEAARPGMVIMILWSGLIGYRRFYQGILIRSNKTRAVGIGTAIRVSVSASVAVALGAWSGWSGVAIGASAMMAAVTAEAVYAVWASRSSVETIIATESPVTSLLSYRAILGFHLPLAATSLLSLLVRPILESGLASTDEAKQALAAWAVIWEILLVLRAGGFAFQEVVIALSKNEEAKLTLRRFMWITGLTLSGSTLIFSVSPLIKLYLERILDAPENIHHFVAIGTQAAILIPLLATIQSFYRAMHIKNDNTAPIYQAMIIGMLSTSGILVLLLQTNLAGTVAVGISMSIGLLLETFLLWYRYTLKTTKRVALAVSSGD